MAVIFQSNDIARNYHNFERQEQNFIYVDSEVNRTSYQTKSEENTCR